MLDSLLSWWTPSLGDGERLLIVPFDAGTPIVVPVALLAAVVAIIATRKWWMRQFRALAARLNQPRLDTEERLRLVATEERLARLLAMVDNPRAVRDQVLETLAIYRKRLHRRGQLRRYLGAGDEDLQTMVVGLAKKLEEAPHGVPDAKRRSMVEAAQRAARNRIRTRARAMCELETIDMELIELENRLWAFAETHIVRSDAVHTAEEVNALLERLTAEEATDREIEELENRRL